MKYLILEAVAYFRIPILFQTVDHIATKRVFHKELPFHSIMYYSCDTNLSFLHRSIMLEKIFVSLSVYCNK